jgi:hypothetical protein
MAMKLTVLWTCVSAVSAAILTKTRSRSAELVVDTAACVAHATKFLDKPVTKERAIEKAMDHCALDKKVDDNNFVCPHYRTVLSGAFQKESTTKLFDAAGFCQISENYVSQLKSAAEIPHMGAGSGPDFEVSKHCEPTSLANFAEGSKTLLASKVPDFWFAMCMNQDCGHFLPSRTRWCNVDRAPTHGAAVCEAVRSFAREDVTTGKDYSAEEVCGVYDDFVKETHINVEAYEHVVYGDEDHHVPIPGDKKRALGSAQMKHDAGAHEIRDSAGSPVKSAAASEVPAKLLLSLLGVAGLSAGAM